MIDVTPLSPTIRFGCLIRGLTAAAIADDATRARLRDLWVEHGLVVFRDGPCDADFQVELSRCFGPLRVHAVPELLHPEREELFVAKSGAGGLLSVNGEVLGGYIPWHSDQVFTAETNHGGILRVAHQPPTGGNTAFIDQAEAYDALPQALKDEIADLEVVYQLKSGTITNFTFLPHQRIEVIAQNPFQDQVEARIARGAFPPVVHPLVFVHSENGRKVLNLSPMFADRILGMDKPRSDALLWRLAEHLTDERRAYDHVWQADDLVLWDDWRMIHCARGVPGGGYREVHRTSIAGAYALGRMLETDGAGPPG